MEFSELFTIDKSISVILSGLVIFVILKMIKASPKILELYEKMISSLDRMSDVTERNSIVINENSSCKQNFSERLDELTTKIVLLEKALSEVQNLTKSEVEWGKEQIRIGKEIYKHQTGKDWVDHIHKLEDGSIIVIKDEGSEQNDK